MPYRMYFIILISLILFPIAKRDHFPKKKSYSSYKKRESIEEKLLDAYILGNKRPLRKDIIKDFKALNLMHLFTPSGLHLSSLLIILSFVLKKLKWLQVLVCSLSFWVEGYFAIKRIALLKIFNLVFQKIKIQIDILYIFLIVFIFDYIFGTYSQSPLSFASSFLFLGILFSLKDSSFLQLIWGFFFGQVIISYFFYEPFTYLGFIPGFFLTALFSLLFPFYVVGFFIDYPGLNELLSIFLIAVKNCSSLVQVFGWSFSSIPILLFFSLSFSSFRKWGVILLIIHSSPLLNFPLNTFKYPKPMNMNLIENEVLNIKRSKRGYYLKRKNGDHCSVQLIPIGHYLTCF